MKTNNARFKAIGILLSLSMTSSVFLSEPTIWHTSFAGENNVAHMIALVDSSDDLKLKDVVITEDGDYEISDIDNTEHSIIIEEGITANLTITNVNITSKTKPAIWVKTGATLNLTVEGTNTLTGGPGFAGINVEPAYDSTWHYLKDQTAVLNISGSGTLTATGGNGTSTIGGGAGIGGNGQDTNDDGVDFGTVTITEDFTGTINATGGYASAGTSTYGAGAGIGTGGLEVYFTAVEGIINIESGTINATGGDAGKPEYYIGGAGIGSGGVKGNGTAYNHMIVTINEGTINATGGALGAGIGGGSNCDAPDIYINGGTIIAIGKPGDPTETLGATGIGGGDNGAFDIIKITGGTIKSYAEGNSGAAGIGIGSNSQFGTEGTAELTISGEDTMVWAYGGTGYYQYGNTYRGGAGIGAGYLSTSNKNTPVNIDIQITEEATVYSYGGYHSQAIGYGYKEWLTNPEDYFLGTGIELKLDDSIELWAVNTDYFLPALVSKANNTSGTIVDVGHIEYVSTERYLVTHTNYNGNGAITTGTAVGSLTSPELFEEQYPVDVDINWNLTGYQMRFEFTPEVKNIADLYYPFADSNKVGDSDLHGNWATLAPAIIKVDYEFVGEYPDDVNTPDMEYVAKNSEYTAKEQNPSADEEWIFDGWYYDEECTQKFEDGDILESNTTLFGKWTKGPIEEEKINVSYEFVGEAPEGVEPPQGEEVDKGTSYNSKEQDTSNVDDWTFEGWFTDEDCTIPYEEGTVLEEDTILYGKWTRNTTEEPETPTPEEPKEDDDTPNTYDNAMLWLMVMSSSLLSFGLCLLVLKKKQYLK